MDKIISCLMGVIIAFGTILGNPSDVYSRKEIDLMARVVMNEGGASPLDEKQLIAETILNRVDSDLFPNTIEDVIYQPYQFSTGYYREPDADCYLAVEYAIHYRAFPRDMLYFRNDYVSYGYFYTQIPGSRLVFSTLTDYNN